MYCTPLAWLANQHWHLALLQDHMLETFLPAATPHAAHGDLAKVVEAGQPLLAGLFPILGHSMYVGLSADTPLSQLDSLSWMSVADTNDRPPVDQQGTRRLKYLICVSCESSCDDENVTCYKGSNM